MNNILVPSLFVENMIYEGGEEYHYSLCQTIVINSIKKNVTSSTLGLHCTLGAQCVGLRVSMHI